MLGRRIRGGASLRRVGCFLHCSTSLSRASRLTATSSAKTIMFFVRHLAPPTTVMPRFWQRPMLRRSRYVRTNVLAQHQSDRSADHIPQGIARLFECPAGLLHVSTECV